MKKSTFIIIPLPLLRTFIYDSESIDRMYDTGIILTSRRLNINEQAAYKELVYNLYKRLNELPSDIVMEFGRMEDYPHEEYYNGFVGDRYAPDAEIAYLEEYIANNPAFKYDVLRWYRIYETYRMAGLDTKGVKGTICYLDENPIGEKFDNSPLILLSTEIMQQLYENYPSMRVHEKAMWAMYLGMLSIIGNKEYAMTTSDAIRCRMFGARNKAELDTLLDDDKLRSVYEKFSGKYQYNKLLNAIQDRRMITEIGLKRRTYISTRIKSLDGLIEAIASSERMRDRKTERDMEKQKAIGKYLELTGRYSF